MRVRSLRWLVLFGFAAIAFGAAGYSVAEAQVAEAKPDAEVIDAAQESKPSEWSGSGEHPGKALFDAHCRVCHTLSTRQLTGPGLLGIGERVKQGQDYEGKSVVQRLLEYIKTVDPANPDATKDPYFKEVQKTVLSPGVDMTARGGLPADVTERDILNVIDYMLRFRDIEFDEAQYWRDVKLGRALVSGEAPFEWGGPACAGCHSVGPDPEMLGANIGPNIGHTYVLMRQRGKDEKSNYSDGLKDILWGENAPKAHYYYKDEEGSSPLTESELKVVSTFFEQTARETGTEQTSSYLPIFALLFAALGILVLEPGIVNILFAKEHGEYIDGPYKEEEHHDHGPVHEHHDQAGGEGQTPEADESKTHAPAETKESVNESAAEEKPGPEGEELKGEDKKEDS